MTDPHRVRPHLPMRPLWLCRACGAPWPCAIARLALRDKYAAHPTALALYLCLQLHEAAADLHRLNPHDAPAPAVLYERFLAWTRPRT